MYPQDAHFDEGRLFVLEPLGTALFGCHIGDDFEWELPVGLRRYHIEEVLSQPEASGDYER